MEPLGFLSPQEKILGDNAIRKQMQLQDDSIILLPNILLKFASFSSGPLMVILIIFKMYQLLSYQDLGVKGVTNPNVKLALSGFRVHSAIFSSESADLHI